MISKTIHHIVGPNTTQLIDSCLDSWKIMEAYDYEIVIWDDNKIGRFLLEYHEFAFDAFYYARNHAEAADIARYLIVYTYGGYYVDWDVELLDLTGFTQLSIQYPNGYMLVDPVNGSIASEFFSSRMGDEFLLNLSKDIVSIYETGKRHLLRTPQYSGPFRMRDSLGKNPCTLIERIPIIEVFAYSYDEIRNPPPRKITQPLIHYWVHSWM